MKVLTKAQLLKALQVKFPKAWFKDGAQFDGGHVNAVWSGEGSELPNGSPAFDYYGSGDLYQFGVSNEISKFVEARGWYWECHDCGTYFAYVI